MGIVSEPTGIADVHAGRLDVASLKAKYTGQMDFAKASAAVKAALSA